MTKVIQTKHGRWVKSMFVKWINSLEREHGKLTNVDVIVTIKADVNPFHSVKKKRKKL